MSAPQHRGDLTGSIADHQPDADTGTPRTPTHYITIREGFRITYWQPNLQPYYRGIPDGVLRLREPDT